MRLFLLLTILLMLSLGCQATKQSKSLDLPRGTLQPEQVIEQQLDREALKANWGSPDRVVGFPDSDFYYNLSNGSQVKFVIKNDRVVSALVEYPAIRPGDGMGEQWRRSW